MRDSSERIQYIADYLSSYKTKIEALNKNGLFDTATLYELFAAEICKLWFGQDFTNLNTVRANYPYVDLVSKDGTTYVQVSTGQDIPGKVKSTLENIRKSNDPSFSNISKLYFFVLGNDSIGKVPDYSGKKRIGNIDFSPKTHLISIDGIINRAKTDLEFLNSLYHLILKESEDFRATAEKLDEMVLHSWELMRTNIDGLINGEFEISRDELISQIQSENFRYISVIGDAGSGKSALCKKLLSGEDVVLFARAESILEVASIDQIWSLDISKVLRFLNGKKIIFFVDALEFIADGRKTNIDRLQHLYEVANKHENAYIVTSCRTSDKNAFIRLASSFEIHEYAIPELTDAEIAQVAIKYPVIREIAQQTRYSQLLKSPFYLNMIVTQLRSADDLEGTNGFREFIWNNVICLKHIVLPTGVTTDEVRDTVNKIVFTRAKDFSIGIPRDDIPDQVLSVLLSSDIVTQINNKLRLKYDIFEDICFEQLLDRNFDQCKGDFCAFFASLGSLGRCVFRRYQIWVENKLFIKEGRESFLYSLVFSEAMPEDWKKQTIIGITKSKFCKDFFAEYGTDLINKGLIKDFFKISNLYSFETSTLPMNNGNHRAFLRPIGVGREQLIQMAKNNGLYEQPDFKHAITKMCMDYANSSFYDKTSAEAACFILEAYIDQAWQNAEYTTSHSFAKEITKFAGALNLMAEFCAEWQRDFWRRILEEYKASSRSVSSTLAEEVIKQSFKTITPALAAVAPDELADVAWLYWVGEPETVYDPYSYPDSNVDNEALFGLSENAAQYFSQFSMAEDNAFLRCLATARFEKALRWAINLTNHAADHFRSNRPNEIHQIEFFDISRQIKYTYLDHPDFFFAGIQDNCLPALIGDTVYTIRKAAFLFIERYLAAGKSDYCTKFANWIKRTVLEEANNTMLLGVLEDIGLKYPKAFPGFSLIFASSIDYVMIDSQRVLAQSGAVNFLGRRYVHKGQAVLSLREYMLNKQLFGNPEEKALCRETLDYLYSIVPNDEEHAVQHLQIQKLDLHKAKIIASEEKYTIVPQVTGAAEKVVVRHRESKNYGEQALIEQLEQIYKSKGGGKDLTLTECLEEIEKLEEKMKSPCNPSMLEREYIQFLSCALSKKELGKELRSAYCLKWIDGLSRIFEYGSFVYDTELTHILFEQADEELTIEAQRALKQLFLDIALRKNRNGLISSIGDMLTHYLSSNERWSMLLFNTILALAKDEMTHNLYNISYAKKLFNSSTDNYQPNIYTSPVKIDQIIIKHKGNLYQSQKEMIIEKYLFNEESLVLTEFDISQYDISILCRIVNCGVSISKELVYTVTKAIVHQLITIWYAGNNTRSNSAVINVYDEVDVRSFLNRELLATKSTDLVIDLLFSEFDPSRFVSDTYEFYEEVLIGYLPRYIDAYNDAALRRNYKEIAGKIEVRVRTVTDKRARTQLYRVLFLPSPKFYHGDWSTCKTHYSYADKLFINSLWEKYGKYHLIGLLTAIYEMQIDKLLPEVLPSVSVSLRKAKEESTDFIEIAISQSGTIINEIITTAYVEKEDQIKQSYTLTAAFESLLELLVDYGIEIAAVILDEFRIH